MGHFTMLNSSWLKLHHRPTVGTFTIIVSHLSEIGFISPCRTNLHQPYAHVSGLCVNVIMCIQYTIIPVSVYRV